MLSDSSLLVAPMKASRNLLNTIMNKIRKTRSNLTGQIIVDIKRRMHAHGLEKQDFRRRIPACERKVNNLLAYPSSIAEGIGAALCAARIAGFAVLLSPQRMSNCGKRGWPTIKIQKSHLTNIRLTKAHTCKRSPNPHINRTSA